jgi:F-type H+-transporting ATPase subunit b
VGLLVAAAGALLILAAEPALAAKAKEAMPEWRVIWNQVWKILNFLILAFLIFKLGRQPIKDFISGQKTGIASTIQAMEEAKAAAEAERAAIEARTANLEKELEDIETYLAERAARQRETMVEEAQREARLIIERAEMLGERALREARSQLVNEMVELASQMAEETLRRVVNETDRAKFLDDFAKSLAEVDLAPQG